MQCLILGSWLVGFLLVTGCVGDPPYTDQTEDARAGDTKPPDTGIDVSGDDGTTERDLSAPDTSDDTVVMDSTDAVHDAEQDSQVPRDTPEDPGQEEPPAEDTGNMCPTVPRPAEVDDKLLPDLDPLGRTESTRVNRFTDDYLYNGEGSIKVGIRREWGASLIFFGTTDGRPGMGSANTIDANDTGREVQIALYDHTRSQQGCAWNASCPAPPESACPHSIRFLGWNPVQGGNRCNRGSGVESVDSNAGTLLAQVIPFHWNPDWERQNCEGDGCRDQNLRDLRGDVRYFQRLRFVHSHIVELQMVINNLSAIDHPETLQEFPTVYTGFGANGIGNYGVFLSSQGQQITIDQPANDGFFFKAFESPGGWVTLQNDERNYGMGIYYENRMASFHGWQRHGTFNSVRAAFSFAIPARGTVQARAYLMLGNFDTVAGLAGFLDANLPPFGYLDSPGEDEEVGGELTVGGWVLDNKGVTQVDVRIDGSSRGTATLGGSRPDVCLVHPKYPGCPNVGFDGRVPLSGLTPCHHIVEIAATDNDGNTRVIARRRIRVRIR